MNTSGAGAVTFGGEILKCLGHQDTSASQAAAVLVSILEGNVDVKRKLLGVTINMTPQQAAPPANLLTHCVAALSNALYTPGNILASASEKEGKIGPTSHPTQRLFQ